MNTLPDVCEHSIDVGIHFFFGVCGGLLPGGRKEQIEVVEPAGAGFDTGDFDRTDAQLVTIEGHLKQDVLVDAQSLAELDGDGDLTTAQGTDDASELVHDIMWNEYKFCIIVNLWAMLDFLGLIVFFCGMAVQMFCLLVKEVGLFYHDAGFFPNGGGWWCQAPGAGWQVFGWRRDASLRSA
ncbi:MAG TPA: hypothetical protein VJ754_06275 [Anaerolineae bacterium]|nr:hypothetical protein [Anaerolineae bacterium]